jgi:hypothetical protein
MTFTIDTPPMSFTLPVGSNSLEFPKPAGPYPETRLAGYKPKGVIQRLFPSNVATMLLKHVHTCLYNVQRRMYRFANSCPGGQDSR